MDKQQQVIDHPQQALIALQPILAPDAGFPPPGYGGLRCHWCDPYRLGTGLSVEIVTQFTQTRATAIVTSCRLDSEGYCLEMGFCDPQEAFAVRMIAQLCHIQSYREYIEYREGRHLSSNQAAREWIERHAEDFPAA